MPDVGLFSFLKSVSPLLCERRKREEQLSGLRREDLRRIVPATESIPKLLFKEMIVTWTQIVQKGFFECCGKKTWNV